MYICYVSGVTGLRSKSPNLFVSNDFKKACEAARKEAIAMIVSMGGTLNEHIEFSKENEEDNYARFYSWQVLGEVCIKWIRTI